MDSCTIGVILRAAGPLAFKVRDRSVDERPTDECSVRSSRIGRYVGFGSSNRPGIWCGFNDSGLVIVGSTSYIKTQASDLELINVLYQVEQEALETSSCVKEACRLVMDLVSSKAARGLPVGANLLIADRSSAVALEIAGTEYALEFLSAKPYLMRTNHFSLLSHLNAPRETNRSSYLRFGRAAAILDQGRGPDDLVKLTRDHRNGPGENSVCRHGEAFKTVSSVIIDVSRQMRAQYVLNSSPCS